MGFTSVLLIEIEALFESVNTSAGVYKLLLTGKERVALRADFNLDALLCGTGFNLVAASAFDDSLFVFRMDSFLHCRHPSHKISKISSPSDSSLIVVHIHTLKVYHSRMTNARVFSYFTVY